MTAKMAETIYAEARGICLIMPFGRSPHEDTVRMIRHLRPR